MNPTTKGVIKLLTPRKQKKYAIHMELLAYKLNTTTRQVRLAIEEIRRENLIKNYFIVSDLESGYYLSKNQADIENWLNHYLGRAFSLIKTAKHAKKFVKVSKFQTKLKL